MPAVPLSQLDAVALATLPLGVGLVAKLDAAAAFVAEHLSRYDEAFGLEGRVVTHLDRAVIDATSRRERAAIMGAPARYAEVVPADRIGEDAARPLVGASGEAYATRHAVDVVVYFGLPARQDGPLSADTAAFRQLVEGPRDPTHANLPGLRVAIASQAYLRAPDGSEMPVQGVRTVALRPVWLGSQDTRHEALITLTIDG